MSIQSKLSAWIALVFVLALSAVSLHAQSAQTVQVLTQAINALKVELDRLIAERDRLAATLPVDAVCSAYTATETTWSDCKPDGTQAGTLKLTRTEITEAKNGGQTCDPLTKSEPTTQTCTYVPPVALVTTIAEPATIAAGSSALITSTFPNTDAHYFGLAPPSASAVQVTAVNGKSVAKWIVKPSATTAYQPTAKTAAGVVWTIPSVTVTVSGTAPLVEICGNGIDDDKDGQVDEDCPPPTTAGCEKASGTPSPSNAYYYQLTARPDCVVSYSLRTQAQIDERKFGSYAPKVNYDSTLNAAKWQWNTNDGPSAQQIRLPISLQRPASGSSKLLIVSDHYWDDKWFTEFYQTATQRLQGWKWLQVTSNTSAGGTNENIWFESQMRFVGWDAGILSWFAIRGYQTVRPPTTGGLGATTGQSICGKNFGEVLGPMLNCFKAKPFTWTRVWIEVEERAGDDFARLSIWMADETQNAMPILLNAEMFSHGKHSGFWYEYNTSSDGRVGGPMAAYGRNIVVLKDVADPTSVFAKPVK